MDFNQIIVNIMVVFMVLAVIDRCFGSHFGLGGKLDEALDTIGPMCIPMVGMILLAPIMGRILVPVVSPFFRLLGADPAMFATSILSCDMGGYPLAISMADTPQAGQFAGCILGSSLGGAISFIIPVGISMVHKEYHSYFAIGVLAGIVTVPIGLVTGGLLADYPISMVAHNTLPILIFSSIIAVGLWKAQQISIFLFGIFGRILAAVSTVGFAIGIVQELTSVTIIPGLTSVLDGIKIVGSVAIVLCGAYPMLHLFNLLWGPSIQRFGRFLGIDQTATTGIFGGFANIMPILDSCNHMSPSGVVVSLAFAVSGSCMFGDHLGFIASVDKSMIVPMVVSKLTASFSAVALAVFICKREHFSSEALPRSSPAIGPTVPSGV
ncbi:MAG: ethanolamine utilization protein EutH [Lawsonibacter sp.]